jgi:lysozyme
MNVSDKCLAALEHHEGVRYKPYRDVVGLWTIGVGHLMYNEQARLPNKNKAPQGYSGPFREDFQLNPEDNRVFSKEEVHGILKRDLANFERGVARLCPVPLTQGMFDGLCSFSFNIGLGGLQRSGVRQKLLRGDKEGAADGFLAYTMAGGKVYQGLVNRRKDERAMFLS